MAVVWKKIAFEGDAPTAHNTSHQNGGGDEVSVTGLSGLLADDQHVLDAEVRAAAVSDTAYGAGWNGVTTIAPSKNAVYDKIETLGGATVATGTYSGNGANGRQIAVGFKCGLVIVQGTNINSRGVFISGTTITDDGNDDNLLETSNQILHATDGFIVYSTGINIPLNGFLEWAYWAISE